MAIFASSDGNGHVTVYGAKAISDGQGHVTLLADEVEEGEVIAEDEVSLSLVDTSGYATHSEVEQTAESISLTVARGVANDLEIGGRNLMLNSAAILLNASDQGNNDCSTLDDGYVKIVPKNNGNIYNNGGFDTSEPRRKGGTYTVSFDVLAPTRIGFYWYPSEHITKTGYIAASESWQRVELTYTQTGGDAEGGALFGFNGLVAGQTYGYRNVKLEKGSKATDWTPAPEDVEEHTNASVEEALSQIQQLADKLSMLVTDAEGTTLLEQTSEGWTFNMASVLDGVSANADAAAAAAEELEKLAEYVRITAENNAPVLELGNEGAFKTQVTNEELRFMHGDEKMAYINNEALNIKTAAIESKLNIGGFALYESDDGGLAIVWEGSGE